MQAILVDPKSILIVEDEMVLAMSMESVLKSMGYGVTGIALSGEEAIRPNSRSGFCSRG
jgi:CheY-like chemotaxis protein